MPLVAGILIQYYFHLPTFFLLIVSTASLLVWISLYFLPGKISYTFRWLRGISIQFLIGGIGCLLTSNNDIRNDDLWIGRSYVDSTTMLITLEESLTEKEKTFKAEASVKAVYLNSEWRPTKGRILIYFKKDGPAPTLGYGSTIVCRRPLQAIANSGNPGAFDYKSYCAQKDIYHQLYLTQKDFVVTKSVDKNLLNGFLFSTRAKVINVLQKYIEANREAGVAEALLIGYRNDLDKDLVQAYSNTGVVHIIAISGLHLGMIYFVLVLIFRPFKKNTLTRWLKPVVILLILWLFTLIAGAAPSILRSAVMFSFIVLAEVIDRKTSIYNTLCLSAFVMLCYNPYFLWDVGFQLSYAAVISIVAFLQPIYHWLYFKNKILDFFWKLMAISLAAQILTAPIIFYYFHQFPLLFMISNLVAVPLSTVILYLELLLLIVSLFSASLATIVGSINEVLLSLMNGFIERMNVIPYAVYDGINNSLLQTLILYIIVIALATWLLRKSKPALFISVGSLLVFMSLYAFKKIQNQGQHKVIVYNVPQHLAVDFIAGNSYRYLGDTSLLTDAFLQNFYLKPSRIMHEVTVVGNLDNLYYSYPFIQFNNKRILVIDKPFAFHSPRKITLDVVVVSKNPKLYIGQLLSTFNVKQIVFDASNPVWKINKWKKDCDSLHLPHHSTKEQGAFTLSL